MTALAVVIVTHDSADAIARTLAAVSGQLQPDDQLVVVDNASADDTVEAARASSERVRIIERGDNPGFAAACHDGADATDAPLLLFLNPDAVPAGEALARLRATASECAGWDAWQALVTMDGGTRINTAGGVVHFTGIGWAGGAEADVAKAPTAPTEVAFASGAAFVVRRAAWDAFGGFERDYFMYAEDLDLSLRLRLAGRAVGIEPRALVDHDYSFDKGDYKWFLLERNRWRTLIAVYPPPLLALLGPALLATEVALVLIAARQGWISAKLRSYGALASELPALLRRRRDVQRGRRVGAERFAAALSHELDSPFFGAAGRSPRLRAALALYWRAVRALIRNRT